MYIVCSSNPLTGVSYFYFIIIIIFYIYIYDDRFNAVCKSLRESNEGAVARMTAAAACTRILHYIPIAPRGGAVTADIIYIILYTIAT